MRLDSARKPVENNDMVVLGRVQNGVVVFEGGLTLPEGMQVIVSPTLNSTTNTVKSKHRVRLPLVPSDFSGTFELTEDRIAELLDDDDVSS